MENASKILVMYTLYSTGQTRTDSLSNALSIVDRGLGEITMMRQGSRRSGARAWVEYSLKPEKAPKTAKKQDSKSKKEVEVDVTTTEATEQPLESPKPPKKAKKTVKKAKKAVSKDAGEDIVVNND